MWNRLIELHVAVIPPFICKCTEFQTKSLLFIQNTRDLFTEQKKKQSVSHFCCLCILNCCNKCNTSDNPQRQCTCLYVGVCAAWYKTKWTQSNKRAVNIQFWCILPTPYSARVAVTAIPRPSPKLMTLCYMLQCYIGPSITHNTPYMNNQRIVCNIFRFQFEPVYSSFSTRIFTIA